MSRLWLTVSWLLRFFYCNKSFFGFWGSDNASCTGDIKSTSTQALLLNTCVKSFPNSMRVGLVPHCLRLQSRLKMFFCPDRILLLAIVTRLKEKHGYRKLIVVVVQTLYKNYQPMYGGFVLFIDVRKSICMLADACMVEKLFPSFKNLSFLWH